MLDLFITAVVQVIYFLKFIDYLLILYLILILPYLHVHNLLFHLYLYQQP